MAVDWQPPEADYGRRGGLVGLPTSVTPLTHLAVPGPTVGSTPTRSISAIPERDYTNRD